MRERVQLAYFRNFPVPPTYNHARGWRAVGKRAIPYETPKLKEYFKSVEVWRLQNLRQLAESRAAIQRAIWQPLSMLYVETAFYFPTKEVVTLDGKIKRMDVENRLSDLMDSLAALIEVDDSRFQLGPAIKKGSDRAQNAFVNVRIGLTRLPLEI